jgi:hypothetical protein
MFLVFVGNGKISLIILLFLTELKIKDGRSNIYIEKDDHIIIIW